MPPGTVHCVLTYRESVSTGQMFYLPSHYTQTFYTLIQTHLHGQRVTNSDYLGAHLAFFRLIAYYELVLASEGMLAESDEVGAEWEVGGKYFIDYAEKAENGKLSCDFYPRVCV
jgi:hypothetical protein